jgi:hypothetical protein
MKKLFVCALFAVVPGLLVLGCEDRDTGRPAGTDTEGYQAEPGTERDQLTPSPGATRERTTPPATQPTGAQDQQDNLGFVAPEEDQGQPQQRQQHRDQQGDQQRWLSPTTQPGGAANQTDE